MDAREKRLIDANAFLKDILTAGIGKTIIEYSESDIGYMIRKRPTVDVVEVVRCKDCVNGTVFVNKQGAEYVDCVLDDYSVRKPTDYCSYGERKEGANNDGGRSKTMSVEQMRAWLKSQYGGSWKWVNKVNVMHDEQVIAVYYRLSRVSKHK